MNFREFLKENIVFLDGSMGTMLQSSGLTAGELPERWNITHPEEVKAIHKAYFDAGSHVVSTNTFGANLLHYSEEELAEIIRAAVENVKEARKESTCPGEKFIALDLGPTGKLLKPLGDLPFEDAVALFSKTVKIGVECGVDLVFIETMNDSYETKAALLAVKETCDLPVLVSNAYGEDGKLMTGATPSAMVAMLEGMGADAVGANCSLGVTQLKGVVEELLSTASVPVILKPNAGLPKMVDGKTIYDTNETEFAREMESLIQKGVRLAGGCCGTTPNYIHALTEAAAGKKPAPLSDKKRTVVSSYTHAVVFGKEPLLIGERINPTGKKRLKQALTDGDMDYLLGEAIRQEEKGAHILDVNVGLPEIDEVAMLASATEAIQTVTTLPLQIDTSDAVAMEAALRLYNGKAMINSVNGKKESMEQVFPLVKKYGGVVVALTLDENGIPSDAEGRVKIAEKILKCAEKYGISKKDIVFDTLAMTVSADNSAAIATLGALRTIKEELGCHTSLGVSNVSFGLPNRAAVNGTFFALSLENGLSAAIMNPDSAEMMKVYYTYRALKGMDENCADYIAHAELFATAPVENSSSKQGNLLFQSALQEAISKGLKEKAGTLTEELVKSVEPLSVVQEEIIPALNEVGKGFEEKTVYLPQLLMSAEAAKSAFEEVKKALTGSGEEKNAIPFVLSTVHGDIHDIGKNIVKLLLENYGFEVIDLGKDVPPEEIVRAVIEKKAPFAGLSALMTTTVPAMEETVRQLKEQAPWCRVLVGGAVLNREYAEKMGADFYAKDAMEAVRFVQKNID